MNIVFDILKRQIELKRKIYSILLPFTQEVILVSVAWDMAGMASRALYCTFCSTVYS